MKLQKLHCYIVAWVACVSVAMAQSWSVRTLANDPRHEFHQVAGCPANWPVAVEWIAPGATNPWPDRTVLTPTQLANLYRVIGPTFTNWHRTTWAAFQQAQVQAQVNAAAAREAELRDAFERVDAEWAALNTNAPTAQDFVRVLRRQHALLSRMRPKLDTTVATNGVVSAQGARQLSVVSGQSLQVLTSKTNRPVRKRVVGK